MSTACTRSSRPFLCLDALASSRRLGPKGYRFRIYHTLLVLIHGVAPEAKMINFAMRRELKYGCVLLSL
jgi:hypothetical protein